MSDATISVVIPTFERPTWIKRAVRSLAQQAHAPDEVIPIARDTDAPTHAAIEELARERLPFELRKGVVTMPGFMPPVHEGFRVARHDIVAVMDDDAEALPGMIERMVAHYRDPSVGGVGGRVINMADEVNLMQVPSAKRVGYVSRLGKVVGQMYMEPLFEDPVDVDFLMGGCMSFRRDIARRIEFDWELNRNVASSYELDIGLQVRAMGHRIVFDPKIAIRHYSAPRAKELIGNRSFEDEAGVETAAYNEMRVVLRRLPPWLSAIFLARAVALGSRRGPGVVPWLLGPVARRAGFVTSVAPAAIGGRVRAAARVLADRAR